MSNTEQLHQIIERARMSLDESGDWKKEAGKTHETLIELAEAGGIEEKALQDLKIAARINIKRNLLYETYDEWQEKRTELIKAIIEAINAKRDSVLWIRVLTDCTTGREAKKIVDKLWIRQVNQNLFPALEAEADLYPTRKLMKWYVEMLDQGVTEPIEGKAFNRLAFFYLWYGALDSDAERAKNYFLAMKRRGIAPANPYPGWFGATGHSKMIEALLKGKYDQEEFCILTGYAKKQLQSLSEHGMNGSIEGSDDEIGNVWFSWIEDPYCRDLRETMRRIYDLLLEGPSQDDIDSMDELMRVYGKALRHMIGAEKAGHGSVKMEQGIVFLTAMLHCFDNWLLEIIDLEVCNGSMLRRHDSLDLSNETFFEKMQEWLQELEPFCGKDFRIGEELLALNSLYENLIIFHEKRGDDKVVKELLERQVNSTDAMTVLSGFGAEIGTDFYGMPYCTDQAMKLIRCYHSDGNHEKVRELIRRIKETREYCSPEKIMIRSEESLIRQNCKYALLLKELGFIEEVSLLETEMVSSNEQGEKSMKGISCSGGYIVARARASIALNCSSENDPMVVSGDFIRYLNRIPGRLNDEASLTGSTRIGRNDLMLGYLRC